MAAHRPLMVRDMSDTTGAIHDHSNSLFWMLNIDIIYQLLFGMRIRRLDEIPRLVDIP